MIIKFSIQNFGSIKDEQTLSFEATGSKDLENYYVVKMNSGLRLLKMAYIYGANASGKTTILTALNFLRKLVIKPADKKTDELDYSPFIFHPETPLQNSTLKIEFVKNNVRYAYSLVFNRKAIINEQLDYYKPHKTNIYRRTTDIDKQLTRIVFETSVKIDTAFNNILTGNTLWNNTVLGGFLKTNLENHEMTEVQDWFENYLKAMVHSQTKLAGFVTKLISTDEIKKTDVVEILKKADFKISDIVISEEERDLPDGFIEFLTTQIEVPTEQVDELQKKGKVTSVNLEVEHTVNGVKYNLPLEKESQGTNRYYGFAGILALAISKSVAFPIDELETSLHPDLFKHFILTFIFNSKQSQIICTTHNREILMNKDIFRNDTIWFVDKDENCTTSLYSLADFDSSVIRNTSSVYNAYKIGKLGGAPNLGDNFIEIDEK